MAKKKVIDEVNIEEEEVTEEVVEEKESVDSVDGWKDGDDVPEGYVRVFRNYQAVLEKK